MRAVGANVGAVFGVGVTVTSAGADGTDGADDLPAAEGIGAGAVDVPPTIGWFQTDRGPQFIGAYGIG